MYRNVYIKYISFEKMYYRALGTVTEGTSHNNIIYRRLFKSYCMMYS